MYVYLECISSSTAIRMETVWRRYLKRKNIRPGPLGPPYVYNQTWYLQSSVSNKSWLVSQHTFMKYLHKHPKNIVKFHMWEHGRPFAVTFTTPIWQILFSRYVKYALNKVTRSLPRQRCTPPTLLVIFAMKKKIYIGDYLPTVSTRASYRHSSICECVLCLVFHFPCNFVFYRHKIENVPSKEFTASINTCPEGPPWNPLTPVNSLRPVLDRFNHSRTHLTSINASESTQIMLMFLQMLHLILFNSIFKLTNADPEKKKNYQINLF